MPLRMKAVATLSGSGSPTAPLTVECQCQGHDTEESIGMLFDQMWGRMVCPLCGRE